MPLVKKSFKIVSALFVEKNGCYFGIENVDPWDIDRNAMKYNLNNPIIAHPPCQKWGAFAKVNYKQWGGKHNLPQDDGGCFKFALDTVHRCGGVIEHPANSTAWNFFGIEKSKKRGWAKSGKGWSCIVWQSAYGHKANKATRLYYYGNIEPFELRWERPVGRSQVGFCDQRGRLRNKPTLLKKEANATPIEFRDELIGLALRDNIKG